jgi:hypothetical protein
LTWKRQGVSIKKAVLPELLFGMSTMNLSEKIVKRVLEAVLPGAILAYRDSQSNGEYDFELRYSSGHIAAVEVTASLDESSMRTDAAIRGNRAGGSAINAQECKKTWMLFPVDGADIPKIRRQADSLMAGFERRDVDEIDCLRSYSDSTTLDVCNELQITGARVVADAGAQIIISHPVRGGAVGQDSAVRAAEEEASKPDNIRKLGAAGTTERHLAVYMDARAGVPWISLTEFQPPSMKPVLPVEITDLWLIGHTHNTNEFIAWHGSTSQLFSARTVHCDISDLVVQRTS